MIKAIILAIFIILIALVIIIIYCSLIIAKKCDEIINKNNHKHYTLNTKDMNITQVKGENTTYYKKEV